MCLAIPGQIVEITDDQPLSRSARVSFGGITRPINLAFVPEAGVGDYILAHVGVAISRIDEDEARRVFEYLEQIGELDQGPTRPEPSDEIHR